MKDNLSGSFSAPLKTVAERSPIAAEKLRLAAMTARAGCSGKTAGKNGSPAARFQRSSEFHAAEERRERWINRVAPSRVACVIQVGELAAEKSALTVGEKDPMEI